MALSDKTTQLVTCQAICSANDSTAYCLIFYCDPVSHPSAKTCTCDIKSHSSFYHTAWYYIYNRYEVHSMNYECSINIILWSIKYKTNTIQIHNKKWRDVWIIWCFWKPNATHGLFFPMNWIIDDLLYFSCIIGLMPHAADGPAKSYNNPHRIRGCRGWNKIPLMQFTWRSSSINHFYYGGIPGAGNPSTAYPSAQRRPLKHGALIQQNADFHLLPDPWSQNGATATISLTEVNDRRFMIFNSMNGI